MCLLSASYLLACLSIWIKTCTWPQASTQPTHTSSLPLWLHNKLLWFSKCHLCSSVTLRGLVKAVGEVGEREGGRGRGGAGGGGKEGGREEGREGEGREEERGKIGGGRGGEVRKGERVEV